MRKNVLLSSFEKAEQVVANHFKNHIETRPISGLICGSGFKSIVDVSEVVEKINLADIPGVFPSSVAGHGSELVLLRLSNQLCWVVTGRIHMYEGHSAQQVVASVCLLAALGVKNICLTNAAGSLNPSLRPGTIVLIADHLNLTGQNCLAYQPEIGNEKFLAMANAYDSEYLKKLETSCKLPTGIYAGLLGPTYETMAECRMLGLLGADLVGMSTVQEVIAARFLDLRVVGLSLVTNMAGGSAEAPLSHNEVLDVARTVTGQFRDVATAVVELFAARKETL